MFIFKPHLISFVKGVVVWPVLEITIRHGSGKAAEVVYGGGCINPCLSYEGPRRNSMRLLTPKLSFSRGFFLNLIIQLMEFGDKGFPEINANAE
jgi:hypothetical protein